MAALSQDYKAQRRASPNSRRLRDFGWGAACGALLMAIAVAGFSARAHKNAQATAAAGTAPAAEFGTIYTFPAKLRGKDSEVPLPQSPAGATPAASHGQTR